jgi:hypothetical protein
MGTDDTPTDFHPSEELTETREHLDNSLLPGRYMITLLHSVINIGCMNKLLVFTSIRELRNCKV